MIVYIDTSVIIRHLLGQRHPEIHWDKWAEAYASEVSRVEAFRALDRIRLLRELTDENLSKAIDTFNEAWSRMKTIPLTSMILKRAELPFPTVVKTLDAIHLTSAFLWREQSGKEITLLTHDLQLGRAARAIGLKSFGF